MKNSIKTYIFLFISLISFISCQEGQNQFVDGKKHGPWIEYLDSTFLNEVPKDSAAYYRVIEYENGFSKGLVQDYWAKSNKLQGEEFLVSGPYLENGSRPKDKVVGLVKWFDEETGKINNWAYNDNSGLPDLKKYYTTGFDEIAKDERFDKNFFLANKTDAQTLSKLFDLFNNNPNLFMKKESEIVSRIFESEELSQMIKDGEKDNTPILSYLVMLGLDNLIKNNNDEAVSNEGSYDNNSESYDETYTQDESYQQERRECSRCNGSGKCKECGKTFRKSYYKGNGSYDNRNEYRPGLVMCSDCWGRGHKQVKRTEGGWEPGGDCYVSDCQDGWKSCRECNNYGNGKTPGQCKECNGTGYRN
jgi:hypothetical protein